MPPKKRNKPMLRMLRMFEIRRKKRRILIDKCTYKSQLFFYKMPPKNKATLHMFTKKGAKKEEKEEEKEEEEIFPIVVPQERFQWDSSNIIGSGAHGTVYKAWDTYEDMFVAIKKVNTLATKNSEKTMQQTIQETEILARLVHPNIARLVSSFKYSTKPTTLYIAMELCTGGELFYVIANRGKDLNERIAKKITKQLLEAVEYCHEQGIAHLDIKPENIVLAEEWRDSRDNPIPDIKLIDFGLASTLSIMGECLKLKNCERKGTAEYIAPEVMKKIYNKKADIWSIGCVVYTLLSGYTPFEYREGVHGLEMEVTPRRVGNLKFEKTISNSARNFIISLLTYDYEKRPDATNALKHRWLRPSNAESDSQSVPGCVYDKLKFMVMNK
jgi:calcium-dependent protein kinase